jgi:hypothetical protein
VAGLTSFASAQSVHLFGPLGAPPNPLRAAAVCDPCSDPFLNYQPAAVAPEVSFYGDAAYQAVPAPAAGCSSCQSASYRPIVTSPTPVTSYRPINYAPAAAYTLPTQSYWSGGRFYSSGRTYHVVPTTP